MSVYETDFKGLNPDGSGKSIIEFTKTLPPNILKKVKKLPIKYTHVGLETLRAYADCWEGGDDAYRELDWVASSPVPRDVAVQIMEMATPCGYNGFKPLALKKLPEDTSLLLAREGSPCVYCFTDPGQSIVTRMKADEYGGKSSPNLKHQLHNVRLWWD